MTLEMIAGRWARTADNADTERSSGLGLAPVPEGYHRWPEDSAPAPEDAPDSWAGMFVLYRYASRIW